MSPKKLNTSYSTNIIGFHRYQYQDDDNQFIICQLQQLYNME